MADSVEMSSNKMNFVCLKKTKKHRHTDAKEMLIYSTLVTSDKKSTHPQTYLTNPKFFSLSQIVRKSALLSLTMFLRGRRRAVRLSGLDE